MEINPKLFEPLERKEEATSKVLPSLNYWQDAWIRLKKSKLAVAGLIIIIFIVIFSFLGPVFLKSKYFETSLYNAYKSPTLEHPFGTDELGREYL